MECESRTMNNLTIPQMVEMFQCPGCVCGCDTDKCGSFRYDAEERRCMGHVLGTMIGGPAGLIALGVPEGFCHVLGTMIAGPSGLIALGLPKGFCKPPLDNSQEEPRLCCKINVRLWQATLAPIWDKFNMPVWAMIRDGFLFVRTFAPRVDHSWVDVVEGGSLDLVPGALDVSEFYDDFD